MSSFNRNCFCNELINKFPSLSIDNIDNEKLIKGDKIDDSEIIFQRNTIISIMQSNNNCTLSNNSCINDKIKLQSIIYSFFNYFNNIIKNVQSPNSYFKYNEYNSLLELKSGIISNINLILYFFNLDLINSLFNSLFNINKLKILLFDFKDNNNYKNYLLEKRSKIQEEYIIEKRNLSQRDRLDSTTSMIIRNRSRHAPSLYKKKKIIGRKASCKDILFNCNCIKILSNGKKYKHISISNGLIKLFNDSNVSLS